MIDIHVAENCTVEMHDKKIILFFLSASPRKENLNIISVPDPAEVGTKVELTCTMSRIMPLASDMYWVVDGQRVLVAFNEATRNKDGTFAQNIRLNYT